MLWTLESGTSQNLAHPTTVFAMLVNVINAIVQISLLLRRLYALSSNTSFTRLWSLRKNKFSYQNQSAFLKTRTKHSSHTAQLIQELAQFIQLISLNSIHATPLTQFISDKSSQTTHHKQHYHSHNSSRATDPTQLNSHNSPHTAELIQ